MTGNLWDRQPGETHRAFAAFCLYRDLPSIDRTVLAARALQSTDKKGAIRTVGPAGALRTTGGTASAESRLRPRVPAPRAHGQGAGARPGRRRGTGTGDAREGTPSASGRWTLRSSRQGKSRRRSRR